MRYAVTGAAGFIGSHLGDALVEAGQDVVGLDSFTDYYDPALKEENARGLDVRRVDLADAPLDFAGFDGVFHLAGQPGARSEHHPHRMKADFSEEMMRASGLFSWKEGADSPSEAAISGIVSECLSSAPARRSKQRKPYSS